MTSQALRELSCLLRPAGGGLYLVSTGRAEQQALQRRFYEAHSEEDITERFLATLDEHKQLAVLTRPGLAPALTAGGNFSPDEATDALAPAGLLLYEHRGREPLRIVLLRATD